MKALKLTSLTLAAWLILFVTIALLLASAANAHQATTGWSYPTSCCSNQDCREVPHTAIVEGAREYEIVATHELIPMTDYRIKPSPDGEFHWCSVAGADDGRTICLFVPDRGY